ncbi:MAG: hypothetical protein B7X52_04240 [Thiotrichales bacterium 34-46-19]|nr:MAG: hypothetical protein B7X52_04240 [Thiotrichales bacterium 34-46-19]
MSGEPISFQDALVTANKKPKQKLTPALKTMKSNANDLVKQILLVCTVLLNMVKTSFDLTVHAK